MTADVENLILERLRRIDSRLEGIQTDFQQVKVRLGHLERGQAELLHEYATVSTRMDRIDLRIERIERRSNCRMHRVTK